MSIFDITPGSVSPVEILSQFSGPGGAAINAGAAVYRNATTGWIHPCGSVNAAEGIAITTTTYVGQGITAMRNGLIDLGGSALTGLSFGASLYVWGEAAGSALGSINSVPSGGGTYVVGTVTGVSQSFVSGTLGTDKLLYINL
jgi:hypothetical protein